MEYTKLFDYSTKMYVSNSSLEDLDIKQYIFKCNNIFYDIWNIPLTKQNSTPLTMNCSGWLGFPLEAFRFLLCGQFVLPRACRHLRLRRLQMATRAVAEIHDEFIGRQLRS